MIVDDNSQSGKNKPSNIHDRGATLIMSTSSGSNTDLINTEIRHQVSFQGLIYKWPFYNVLWSSSRLDPFPYHYRDRNHPLRTTVIFKFQIRETGLLSNPYLKF